MNKYQKCMASCEIAREVDGYAVWPCHYALSLIDARGGAGRVEGRVSRSRIQRRCGLGYGRADAIARLIEDALCLCPQCGSIHEPGTAGMEG